MVPAQGWALAALAGALQTLAAHTAAHAGGFSVREQSAYFMGTAFAGSAAGSEISSVFWNSAATASLPGCNSSSNYTGIFADSDVTAREGAFVTGLPPIAAGLHPTAADIGRDGLVPASYMTCQLSDRLYAGLAFNAPFGLLTKPNNTTWAGSPIAITSRIFSVDINPTLAYKLTPEWTIGIGVQIEYFKLRLTHGAFNLRSWPVSGSRSFDADDWGVGATAGVLWQPNPGTSVGLGYRSAVGIDASGSFVRSAGQIPAVSTSATGSLTLPDELTLSARQVVGPRLAIMGTVEWQNWSQIGRAHV